METINLTKDSNQSMSILRDSVQYSLTLRSYAGIVLASVKANGIDIVETLPCVRNGWLIPYSYLVGDGGNMRFESTSDDYPSPDGFGTKYNLVYYTHDEYVEKVAEEEG